LMLGKAPAQNNRVWATYYGGIQHEGDPCVVTDQSGNVYIGGTTTSTAGIASGGFQNTFGGGQYDAFLVKFDASGNRLWATYYGSIGEDYGVGICTDASGNIFLAGKTDNTSGIASGGFQNSYGGGFTDAFLVKFNPSGTRLWATYYGGSDEDQGKSIATDAGGNIYLAGISGSTASIASGGFQNVSGGATDAFLVKFNSSGNRLWSTYYGGADNDEGFAVTADPSGNIYLAGNTYSVSNTAIASGGFQNTFGGGACDAFLVKFDAGGNRLWATFYGGTDFDFGYAAATDLLGNVYLVGITNSTGGMASGGFQNSFGGLSDTYLAKFNPSGNRLWATYYGGADNEEGLSVTCDATGNVFLAGDSYSSSGIASGGYQNSLIGTENEMLVKFNAAGGRICATYYGQVHDEEGKVSVDAQGNVYLVGYTQGTTGIASGGFQNTFGGINDLYLVKFSSCGETGLAEEEGANAGFKLFPNPNNGTFQVETCGNPATLFLYNSLGQKIHEQRIHTGNNPVKTENLKAGMYTCLIHGEDQPVFCGKVAIQ